MSTFTLAITVNDTTQAGNWYFPDPSQVANNPQSLPTVEISENNTPVPGYTSLLPTSIKKPIPFVTVGTSATAYYTYLVSPKLPAGSYTVSLVPNNAGHVFHMYSSSSENSNGINTAPVCNGVPVPVGQLPEVPFAAAIPLAGIAVGVVWYRRARARA